LFAVPTQRSIPAAANSSGTSARDGWGALLSSLRCPLQEKVPVDGGEWRSYERDDRYDR